MKAPGAKLQPPEKHQIPGVKIFNRQQTKKISTRLLRQIIASLCMELKIENTELGINLVGAKEMAELNWKFLQHKGSTDVITFDYAALKRRKKKCLHGELFVCVDEAISQSTEFKTTWQSEIVRYIVHGILHLLGHDDSCAEARRKMKREENRRLRELSRRFALSKL